jgi:polygalacturonase
MIRTLVVVIPLIFASVLSSGAAPSAPRPSGVATNSFDVRDFGARGDGKTKDTTAVQRALDACAAAGGGTVVVPAGNYLIGSVVIGPSTTLKLEARAKTSSSAIPRRSSPSIC